ncbi:MAG: DUF2752 domain-containing protein [Dysgonomonas sp.]|nr:DUF2752 domain-containing protein [Dysgonomonas sp.]
MVLQSTKTVYIKRLTGIVLALLIAGGIYYLFSPEESRFFPQCPFHYLTGFDCPGCGSQRAIHHLLHREFKFALYSNPLLVVAIPYIIIGIYMEYFGGKERFPRLRQIAYGKKAAIIILVLILVFWLVRNLI